MARGKVLSSEECAQILALHREGLSKRSIAAKLNRSPGSISNFLKDPNSYNSKKRTGRPRLFTTEEESLLGSIPFNCTKSLTELRTELGINFSKSTIWRAIKRRPCPHVGCTKRRYISSLNLDHNCEMTLKRLSVAGYDALKKAVADSAGGKIFVLYTGAKVNGVSWCPDCVTAEPHIEKALGAEDVKNLDATFIICDVGQRDYWKNQQCPFRTDPEIKINSIPTLALWGSKVKRLGDSQLTSVAVIKELLLDED